MPAAGAATALLGRYVLCDEIASGGMATVHLGRLLGGAGFTRTVAIKRLHPQLAKEPEFVTMFLDEARLASRIQHPNSVATLDVIAEEDELLLVMEYVEGEALSKLLRASAKKGLQTDPAIVNSIVAGALHGLHAAHEARDPRGEPLQIVHRDISPQNILVGVDGVARILDFGVAKAAMRLQTTREGTMKGKLAYMAPEQLRAEPLDRRADLFAAAVVHWEGLSGRRLFAGDDVGELLGKVLNSKIPRCSEHSPAVTDELDEVVLRALSREREQRYQTALEYAAAIETVGPLAPARLVAEWVKDVGGEALHKRSERVRTIEQLSPDDDYASDERLASARARLHANPRAFTAHAASSPALVVDSSGETEQAVTVAEPLARRPQERSRRWLLPALGAVGASAVLAAVLSSRGTSNEAPAAAGSAPVATASALAPPSAVVATPEPSAAAPVASAATGASASTGAAAGATAKVSAKANACDPPYLIDSRGIRRVKPGCG